MKREIIKEFDMLGDALSTLNAQFAYRLMNLCVKAEPVSLLSIEAMIEGEPQKLEILTTTVISPHWLKPFLWITLSSSRR